MKDMCGIERPLTRRLDDCLGVFFQKSNGPGYRIFGDPVPFFFCFSSLARSVKRSLGDLNPTVQILGVHYNERVQIRRGVG